MSTHILRKKSRPGGEEAPFRDSRGYQLADPRFGEGWHKIENATFTDSIQKAADLIERRGFAIRMGRKGKRPSLISPAGIEIIRD